MNLNIINIFPRSNNPINFNQLQNIEFNSKERCEEHYNKIEYFCKNCQIGLCYLCNETHLKEYIDHTIIDIEKYILSTKEVENIRKYIITYEKQFEKTKNDINSIMNEIKKFYEKLNEYYKTFLKEKEKIIKEMKELFEDYKNCIRKGQFQYNIFIKMPLILNNTIEEIKLNKTETLINKISYIQNYFESKIEINSNEKQIKLLSDYDAVYTKKDTDLVTSMLSLNNSYFILGYSDGFIKIFQPGNFESILSFYISKLPINYLSITKDNKILVCVGSEIKILDFENSYSKYKIISILKEQTGTVYQAHELNNKLLVSCSSEQSLFFWDNSNYECIYKNIHRMLIPKISTFLEIPNNNLVMLSEWEEKVNFLNIYVRQITHTINRIKCKGGNSSICMINNNYLALTGYIGIYIIEIKNHQISLVIKPNDNVYINIIPLNDGTFITTELSNHKDHFFGDMKQWKITANGNNWECISEKKHSHLSCIIGLIQLNNGNIISTSFDQNIKIWK